jgi:hypothetical protein
MQKPLYSSEIELSRRAFSLFCDSYCLKLFTRSVKEHASMDEKRSGIERRTDQDRRVEPDRRTVTIAEKAYRIMRDDDPEGAADEERRSGDERRLIGDQRNGVDRRI